MSRENDAEIYTIENLNEHDRDFVEAVDAYFYEMCLDSHVVDDYTDELKIGMPELENMLIDFLRNFVEWQQSLYVNCRQDFIETSIDAYSYAEQMEIKKSQKERENNDIKNIDDYRADTPSNNS